MPGARVHFARIRQSFINQVVIVNIVALEVIFHLMTGKCGVVVLLRVTDKNFVYDFFTFLVFKNPIFWPTVDIYCYSD